LISAPPRKSRRIYFGKDGERLVILIGGGTKKRQDIDIAAAQACWADYKRRKKHAPYP
jgi:putative component of toxin-antitoxin plasmid stabilization module